MAALTRSTANRAVHLRIYPRPSNLGESREIMRLISQFGEVEYFKNLKYDALPSPTTALVIYKDENAAAECCRRSPIRFRMGRVRVGEHSEEEGTSRLGSSEDAATILQAASPQVEAILPRGPLGTPFGLGSGQTQTRSLSTSSLPRPPGNPIRMPFDPPPAASPPPDDSRIFQLNANPSNRYFRDHVNAGHYHGPFALDSKMPGQEDLAKRVPVPGLSCVDWKAEDQKWRIANAMKKKGVMRLGEVHEKAKADRENHAAINGG